MDVPTLRTNLSTIRSAIVAVGQTIGNDYSFLYLQASFNNFALALEQENGVTPGAFGSSGQTQPLPIDVSAE